MAAEEKKWKWEVIQFNVYADPSEWWKDTYFTLTRRLLAILRVGTDVLEHSWGQRVVALEACVV